MSSVLPVKQRSACQAKIRSTVVQTVPPGTETDLLSGAVGPRQICVHAGLLSSDSLQLVMNDGTGWPLTSVLRSCIGRFRSWRMPIRPRLKRDDGWDVGGGRGPVGVHDLSVA